LSPKPPQSTFGHQICSEAVRHFICCALTPAQKGLSFSSPIQRFRLIFLIAQHVEECETDGKKEAAVIALLIVASLFIAGCIKSTTTPVTPPDPQLAQYIEAYDTTLRAEHPNNLTAWLVTPINASSANITDAWTYPSSTNSAVNLAYTENVTLIRFCSPDAATAYVDNNSAGYRLVATSYPSTHSPEANQRAKGNATTAYAIYDTGSSLGTPGSLIVQTDQYVWIGQYEYMSAPP